MTGVQTCALPICPRVLECAAGRCGFRRGYLALPRRCALRPQPDLGSNCRSFVGGWQCRSGVLRNAVGFAAKPIFRVPTTRLQGETKHCGVRDDLSARLLLETGIYQQASTGPTPPKSTPRPVTLLPPRTAMHIVLGPRGRRPKHASRQFDTFIHMPFKSARTIGYRTMWMSALLLSLSANGSSQDLTVHDPGVRGGNAGAGGALPGISGAYNNLFVAGLAKFSQEDQVVQDGLGPRMNLNSCAGCHGAPATGGSSPKIKIGRAHV